MLSLKVKVKHFGALRKQEHYNSFLKKTIIRQKKQRYIVKKIVPLVI